ncbi:MAG TPA: hypothetical protein EYP62_09110 [Kiritimatiellae bacterium]|nr:hypothetical protein [Kiritimatiellia bacterium]
MSAEFLFCLASLLFLAWVILLKQQIVRLRRRIHDLQMETSTKSTEKAPQVHISRDSEVWDTHPSSTS